MVKWGISENHIWLKIKMRDRPGQTIPLEKEKEEYIWLMQKKEIGEGKVEKKIEKENILSVEEKKNGEWKGGKYLEKEKVMTEIQTYIH